MKRPEPQSPAVAILQSASRYIYGEAQRAHDNEEHEDFSITLKLLELLQDGWESQPRIFDVACGFAVGLCHARYLYRRAERAALMRREFLSITPDYDYSKETLPGRDPADGRRHYGNQYASRGMDTGAIKEAAARLGITKQTIYQRLRDGWSFERATSEGRQPPGKKPRDGYRFRNLGAPNVAGYEPKPTGLADEDIEATGERPGDFPNADGRYPVPNRPRAARDAALPVADRRGAGKKRISSPAQARRLELFRAANRAAREAATYFGA